MKPLWGRRAVWRTCHVWVCFEAIAAPPGTAGIYRGLNRFKQYMCLIIQGWGVFSEIN